MLNNFAENIAMYSYDSNIRVRYAETDQMNYVYYGNYAIYYEVSRVEALRNLGISYRTFEEKGFMMPVLSMDIKYIKPAFYDDLLTLRAIVKEMPGARMRFDYETYSEQGELLNIGSTVHAIVTKNNMKPCIAPDWFKETLIKYF
jgi:acyl-CoA thioester hydrolase